MTMLNPNGYYCSCDIEYNSTYEASTGNGTINNLHVRNKDKYYSEFLEFCNKLTSIEDYKNKINYNNQLIMNLKQEDDLYHNNTTIRTIYKNKDLSTISGKEQVLQLEFKKLNCLDVYMTEDVDLSRDNNHTYRGDANIYFGNRVGIHADENKILCVSVLGRNNECYKTFKTTYYEKKLMSLIKTLKKMDLNVSDIDMSTLKDVAIEELKKSVSNQWKEL